MATPVPVELSVVDGKPDYKKWIEECEPIFDQLINAPAPEGFVCMPRSYFLREALRDYDRTTMALPREFIQNSADADSKHINISSDNETATFFIEDDGCGMSEDTIINKLLVLGGSQKKEGDVGGFGKAKTLLYFSWDKYLVHTHDLLVVGAGSHYKIYSVPYFKEGTSSIIKMWDKSENKESVFGKDYPDYNDYEEYKRYFTDYISRCNLKATVNVFGKEIFYKSCGRKFAENEFFIAYSKKNENGDLSRCDVFAGGLWMFVQYLRNTKKMEQVTLEIKGKSSECLCPSRENFRGEAKKVFDEFIMSINASPEKTKAPDDILTIPSEARYNRLNKNEEYTQHQNTAALSSTIELCPQRSETSNFIIKETNDEIQDDKSKPKKTNFPFVIEYERQFAKECNLFIKGKIRTERFERLWRMAIDTAVKATSGAADYIDSYTIGATFKASDVAFCLSERGNACFTLNLRQFNFKQWDVSSVTSLCQTLLFVAAHEASHIKYDSHYSEQSSEHYTIYRAMFENNPHLLDDMIKLARPSYIDTKRAEERLNRPHF